MTTAAVTRPKWVRIVRAIGVACAGIVVVGSPWWGTRVLAQFDYFHVRRVEIIGVRYAKTTELVRSLGVDTMQSVWQDMIPLATRVARHPLVASAAVERKLPGTLIVHVVERVPVAFVSSGGMLRPTDLTGHVLPIDPARIAIDAPVVASADTTLLRLLDAMRREAPTLYARVTEARRDAAGQVRLQLGLTTVRANSEVTVARVRDILPVEADLARNHLRAVELDLRFRDQVIARQP